MKTTIYSTISFDEFEKKYNPKQNHLNEHAPENGWMYETYGEEYDFIKQQPVENIWTVLEEDGVTFISPGRRWVNRLGYIITELPHNDENIDVIDEDDTEVDS